MYRLTKRKQTHTEDILFEHKMYTDGSWNYQTGAGGWAVTLQHRVLKSGNECQTTNIRMEITAIIKALEIAQPSTIILTDSQFTIDSINYYIPSWQKYGWKDKTANKELMRKLWRTWENRAELVELKWVRAHNGLAGNELADAEASRQRKMLEGTEKLEDIHYKSRKPKKKIKKKMLSKRPNHKKYTLYDIDKQTSIFNNDEEAIRQLKLRGIID